MRAIGVAADGPWWRALEAPEAPKIIARLPFVDREDHPAGTPVFVIAHPLPTPTTEVMLYSIALDRWDDAIPVALAAAGGGLVGNAASAYGLSLLAALPGAGGVDQIERDFGRRRRARRARRPRRQPRCARRLRPAPTSAPHSRRVHRVRLIASRSADPAPRRPRDRPLRAGPQQGARSPGEVFKLSSNETPLGASPEAMAAYARVGHHLEAYPDGASTALREAIGARYGLDPDRIVCGAGSDEILQLLTHAYVGPGDEGLYSEYGFLVYKLAILSSGGTPVVAKETNRTAQVDALLAAVTPRTKILHLANPNNPTGTYLPHDELKRLATSLPPHVLLVIDAAYAEYVTRNDYSAGIELVAEHENVVMTRTFSKIYGLAALRLGWCYAPAHVCDAINRIRGPFNVNRAAIEAGVAALADTAHLEKAIAHNERWLPWLTKEMEDAGPHRHAERRQFPPRRFSDQARPDREGRGRISRAITA